MSARMTTKGLLCCYLLVSASAFVVSYNKQHRPASTWLQSTAQGTDMSDVLSSTLKKPSETLAVILDVNVPKDATSSDISGRSMQLRKLGASAIAASDVATAAEIVQEQESAKGNFPGPCPVIYTGDDFKGAASAGVAAVTVQPGTSVEENVDAIYKVNSPCDVSMVDGNAFLVNANGDNLDQTLAAIPAGSVVIASVKSMQEENKELEAKELKAKGLTTILMENAVVFDGEDVEYASFVISGLTKKKSSTFNMSGLTGSTNGHFGGVASSTATTWLRPKRQ